ncbi:PREDICTED: interleukin-10 receptor subunit beta [Sturnus vulgaris]|uniref:interleukin-10 receptor subunit beta n=1 Tax=Sturnus vulgaris TaxID=9172 RepID=UPI00071A13A9|nr:PREDICTED: interleukin-10 receptor subunit beta [Sturnus vulgaris]
MAAELCGGLLLCSGLLLCVSGMIPEPRNARITSVNLHSTLQWDPPRFPGGNITYTVQYKRWGWGWAALNSHLTALLLGACVPGAVPLFQLFQVAQVDTQHSSEILSQLEPWTVYCVQVQAVIPELNKTGQLSRELCEQTTHNGNMGNWESCNHTLGWMEQLERPNPPFLFLSQFLSKPPSASQPFPALPQEELLVYDRLTVISQESQSLGEGSGEEPSGAPEHPEDSAQGEPNSGVGAASGKA